MNTTKQLICWLLAGLVAAPAFASGGTRTRKPLDPVYVEECGSCHVAFPPRALGARSWTAVMGGLANHFGVDASIEPKTATAVLGYLEQHARGKETLNAAGAPELRITKAGWFVREHDEVEADVWQRQSVKSPANCAACHTGAERGNYSERNITIPH